MGGIKGWYYTCWKIYHTYVSSNIRPEKPPSVLKIFKTKYISTVWFWPLNNKKPSNVGDYIWTLISWYGNLWAITFLLLYLNISKIQYPIINEYPPYNAHIAGRSKLFLNLLYMLGRITKCLTRRMITVTSSSNATIS